MRLYRTTRREWLAAAGSVTALSAQRSAQPNIVLLFADDLGYGDLSSYGAPDVATPNIDSIGKSGVRFTQFYSNAPECTPSRAALLTGKYPQRFGGLECAIGVGNVGRYDEAEWLQKRGELGLPADGSTLPQLLANAGYDTACFGKWHLGYEEKFLPRRHGFQKYFGILGGGADYFRHVEQSGGKYVFEDEKPVTPEGYLTDLFADKAVNWIAGRRQPFFLYLPFNAPHSPYQGPGDAAKPLGDWNRGSRATYASMIERMDYQVGRVIEAVRKAGQDGNTIIAFLSDNGGTGVGRNAPLRGGKSRVWEGGIRVPCLMRWPGVIKAGSETPQTAANMDLAATFLDVAGARAPGPIDGISLRPVLMGSTPPMPRDLFWRYKRAGNRRKAVRSGDWKYMWDDGEETLVNLAEDPGESRNLLAASSAQAGRLRSLLRDWEDRVHAPRLKDFPARA
jgi:N-acetylgalactosamine-6-sulfatase